MANPFVGLGTVVGFGNVANSFTTLSGVTGVAFSGDKVSTDKTTNMLSTDGVDTYIPSTYEPGTLDVKCSYQPGDTSQVALEAFRKGNTYLFMQVTYPLGLGHKTANGYCESATIALPLEKLATIDYKFKLSGPCTIV
jgi:hypothetical protein